jgi:predicted nucleotidyltransferase
MAKSRLRDLDGRLEAFARDVEAAAGSNLVSLVLYGSAATGTAREDSDLNLLLILEDAGSAALGALSPALRGWVRVNERPPLIFSRRSWRAAADVFPLEIEDIRAGHRVLRGSDPVAGLTTTRDHQRLELERELRGRMVQLRAAYAAAAGDGRDLTDLVAESFHGLIPLFRAAVRLAGTTPASDPGELVRQMAGLASLDPAAFDWPISRLAGARLPALTAHDPRAARYLDAVDRFVDYVDRALIQEQS